MRTYEVGQGNFGDGFCEEFILTKEIDKTLRARTIDFGDHNR
jgi:hypothetical protein